MPSTDEPSTDEPSTDEPGTELPTAEQRRLLEADSIGVPWRRWGPYLSDRQWGTVREDYSGDGDAWNYFSHDHARSRAYRWGEDGIGGISDDEQRLCFAVAMWNGQDPILKERFFGVTNSEGNHGEDVKEQYFYVDATPTHSYERMLYKYPQRAYPYLDLVETNRNRGRGEFEYELLDTDAFTGNRYFDVVVEHAKAAPEDLLLRITVHNRGPEAATLHLLPTLWFRNTWSWGGPAAKPMLQAVPDTPGMSVVEAAHETLGRRWLLCEGSHPLLFTENETNFERVFGSANPSPYVKDGIGRYVVQGEAAAVNPAQTGTKVAVHLTLDVPAGGARTVRLRLTDEADSPGEPGARISAVAFDDLVGIRRAEADEFYETNVAPSVDAPERLVVRQALAGMLWSKQYYGYDVERWLAEHGRDPADAGGMRNGEWLHMIDHDIISMPDAWEYPWFAAWDLAFHAVALAVVDLEFAKGQLDLLLSRRYLHPNGQIPAYEWNFGDVNPPVHAWAAHLVHELAKARTGRGDHAWLENVFQKLSANFTWWLNRKDVDGRNVFQGGFLGLDNIGVFDRSAPLPTGGRLDQADGTAWMALYCHNMLQISLDLAVTDPVYVEEAQTFFEHFAWITAAVNRVDDKASMWDEQDGLFYDLLRLPDGSATRLKVRSMVSLLPLAAATVFPPEITELFPQLLTGATQFIADHPSVAATVAPGQHRGRRGQQLLSFLDEDRLRRVLGYMLDEEEFFSPYGLRSLSRYHADNPYRMDAGGQRYAVSYQPAESDNGMFGGNSNWRGPIWFPLNALMIRALLNLHACYGEDFVVECPTGSGITMTLFEVARELAQRLTSIFLPGPDGRRPCYGGRTVFADDEHWRDLLVFNEYFHGDNGAGIGASHQTGWTGIAAVFPILFANLTGPGLLESGWTGTLRARDDGGAPAAP